MMGKHSADCDCADGASGGLDEIVDYLRNVPAWYLATSVDGQPHVRPFSFAAKENGKVWFVTATYKDVWQELLANPKFEACSWWPGHGWLVFWGEAEAGAVSDKLRREGYEHLEKLGEGHDGPDDPALVFFTARDLHARIDDIDGSRVEMAL